MKFPNGSRIVALSSNPDTARGYTGDIVLDEFAFHPESEEIFKAAYRQITLGYPIRVISTPNGQQGKFFNMAKSMGLADGIETPLVRDNRMANAYTAVNGWSVHWIDIHRAIADGFPAIVDDIRKGRDEETWLQEYCCNFVNTESQWISPQLFDLNVDPLVTAEVSENLNLLPTRYVGLYAGWDIARHRHLSVIWLNELLGDVALCRGIIELSNIPTPDQVNEARRLLTGRNPIVSRMCIDVGSMGLAMFETLEKEFGSNAVEGVTFSLPTKEALAVHARTKMEKRLTRVPDLDIVRSSFRMVKKTVTTTGAARFDADEEKRYGHADHWWAFCLALSAESHASYGLLSYVQKLAGEGKLIASQEDNRAPSSRPHSQKREESSVCPECGWPHLSAIPGGQRCQQCGAQILKANVTVIPAQNRYAHLNRAHVPSRFGRN